MAANVHVVLSWICDGTLPERSGRCLVEYDDHSHDVLNFLVGHPHSEWIHRDRTKSIVAWARIPSVKGS